MPGGTATAIPTPTARHAPTRPTLLGHGPWCSLLEGASTGRGGQCEASEPSGRRYKALAALPLLIRRKQCRPWQRSAAGAGRRRPDESPAAVLCYPDYQTASRCVYDKWARNTRGCCHGPGTSPRMRSGGVREVAIRSDQARESCRFVALCARTANNGPARVWQVVFSQEPATRAAISGAVCGRSGTGGDRSVAEVPLMSLMTDPH